MRKLKVAVYTICLNESKFVDRFMDCLVGEADEVYVLDTGSTDDTVEKLQARGAIVKVQKFTPWRFDVARNASIDLVPEDYDVMVCIDLDEVLTKGWRDALEASWTPETTRLRYQYVWNQLPDGRDGITFWYDKITTRKNYRWVKPVHEVLHSPEPEVQTFCSGFMLRHFPDNTKSRGSYLPLLEMGCKEEPDDDRNCHYLGREYMYYGLHQKAIDELKRHLSLPRATWEAERAASMRYLGRCFSYLGNQWEAVRWYRRATAEAPNDREPWFELGKHLSAVGDHVGAYQALKEMFKIETKPASYITDPEAWGGVPHDLLARAAWYVGLKDEAKKHGLIACELEPANTVIQNNKRWWTT